MKLIEGVRGMRDLLPAEAGAWRQIETAAAECFGRYSYGEIRTPVVERTDLFRRQLGLQTDVVQKEMYAFEDQGGDSLCLRPEATVPTVRAVISLVRARGGTTRVWYGGPMFRRERPQKGRYRQFWQMGAEAVSAGPPAPEIDAEQIIMLARLWRDLGVAGRLELSLNNLGSADERAAYRDALGKYFRSHEKDLDEASKARIDGNPLRILDSKDPKTAAVAQNSPRLADFLGKDSQRHESGVKEIISAAGIDFVDSPMLVRGLDYYNLTVFEWTLTGDERRQNALCGGGRYDGLSEQIGGPPLAGCGFALGLDRLAALCEEAQGEFAEDAPDCFIAAAGAGASYCMRAAETLRESGLSVWQHADGGKLGKQLNKADSINAALVVIAGSEEEQRGAVAIRRMKDGRQEEIAIENAGAFARKMLKEETKEAP